MAARRDDIRLHLDNVLEPLETTYERQLRGLLPRIYAGSNLDAEHVRGLINLFAKEVFERDHGGVDLIGRVYEYFIGEFASSEGKRGGGSECCRAFRMVLGEWPSWAAICRTVSPSRRSWRIRA